MTQIIEWVLCNTRPDGRVRLKATVGPYSCNIREFRGYCEWDINDIATEERLAANKVETIEDAKQAVAAWLEGKA